MRREVLEGIGKKKPPTNHSTKEWWEKWREKGHVLLWTAQRHDSPGVIMIEWSLIDCLSLQDLQSTFLQWMRPLWQCLVPLLWNSAGLLFPAA